MKTKANRFIFQTYILMGVGNFLLAQEVISFVEETIEEEIIEPQVIPDPIIEDEPLPDIIDKLGSVSFDGTTRESQSEGLTAALRLTQGYTTNLTLSEFDPTETSFTSISPSIAWRSAPRGGAIAVAAFSYSPEYISYYDNIFEDVVNHNLDTTFTYEGKKTVLVFESDFEQNTTSNTIFGSFAEFTQLDLNLSLNHQLSNKSRFNVKSAFSKRETDFSGGVGNEIFVLSLGTLHELTPLISIGPAVRIAYNEVNELGTVSTFGTAFQTSYVKSEKFRVFSNLGLEYVEPLEGGGTISPSGSLTIEYNPSPLFEVTFTGSYAVINFNREERFQFSSFGQNFGDDFLNGSTNREGNPQLDFFLNLRYKYNTDWSANLYLTQRNSSPLEPGANSINTQSLNFEVVRDFDASNFVLGTALHRTDFGTDTSFGNGDSFFSQLYFLRFSSPFYIPNTHIHGSMHYLSGHGTSNFDQFTTTLALSYRF